MINLEKTPRAVQHIIFWIILYAFNLLFWGSSLKNLSFVLLINLFFTIFRIAFAYLNLYYFVPQFLKKNKVQYALNFILGILLISVFLRFTVIHFFYPILDPQDYGSIESLSSIFSYSKQFLIEVYIQSIVMSVKLAKDWLESSKRTIELEKKNISSELNFLKSQIQPHFFFNTLNNLYALCKSDSSKAADSILKLSSVMDYVLYKSSKPRIALNDEWDIVKEYIELEKLRFNERLKISLQFSKEAESVEIPPMLLIPLVENSFKHGLHEVQGNVELVIKIFLHDKHIFINIINPELPKIDTDIKNGIGLSNLEKRLELIYKDDFSLRINRDKNDFNLELKVPIDES